jgi:aminoglycoside phosphotransferase (APT) family kinase protein
MPEWDAEVEIDEPLVRALLEEQFPELATSAVRFLGKGWDNSVWIVDGRWTFRFPRRAIAVPGVERELEVLPRLAPLLPVAVPVPTFVGQPSDRFPWPFFGAPLLPGIEVADAMLSDGERAELASSLGSFLRLLHNADLRTRADPEDALPLDPLGRADMSVRVPRARECLAEVEAAGLWRSPAHAEAILDDAPQLPRSDATALIHGDLHPRHALVHEARLSAVIDWGDVCVGDPSIDLQLVWCVFPPEGRDRFIDAYGPIDDERLLRARAAALYFCAMLATYAESVGHANLLEESLAGLERTLVD